MAFGTLVTWVPARPEKAAAILTEVREFSSYRFVFQYFGPELKDLPSNVIVRKWLPQVDVITHPQTKTFLSHGGTGYLAEPYRSEIQKKFASCRRPPARSEYSLPTEELWQEADIRFLLKPFGKKRIFASCR